MKLRKIIFWMHLIAGVFAGMVVFVMSFTGVALTYQKQMTEWADRAYWPPAAPEGTPRLPIDTILAGIQKAKPDANPSAMTFYSDPQAPVSVTIGAGRTVFVNPYTGVIGGEGSQSIRSFFRVMTDWHRYMGAGGENRPIGKAITGACNVAFLFIVASGFYLWWPRSWTVQSVRNVTWFKRGLAGRARDFNWHNTFGFWTAIPLFLVVLSATIISYPSVNRMVYRLAGVEPPAPARPPSNTAVARPAEPSNLNLAGMDSMVSRAMQHVPEWRTMNLRLPSAADSTAAFTIDRGWGGQPQLRTTLVLDNAADSIRSQTFADQNTGQRARTWLRFVHTGEYYGLTGQTIAGIASAAGVMLVITGFALSIRRFLAWMARRNRMADAPSQAVLERSR